jgi:hypothetical protein
VDSAGGVARQVCSPWLTTKPGRRIARAGGPLLTGFVPTLVTALVAFGIPHVTSSMVSLVNAVIVAIAGFFVHSQVRPKLDTRKA